jgi:hypothetical protein
MPRLPRWIFIDRYSLDVGHRSGTGSAGSAAVRERLRGVFMAATTMLENSPSASAT